MAIAGYNNYQPPLVAGAGTGLNQQAAYPQTGYPTPPGSPALSPQNLGGGYPTPPGSPALGPQNLGGGYPGGPPLGASPGQNANLSATGELNRESQLNELATTRAQIIDQRIETRNSIRQMVQGTVMTVIGEDFGISNEEISADIKFGKDALQNAKAAV